jgi:hypothetical protein
MEEDNDLQDLILTVHHSFMHTFAHTSATKIVENHLGVAYIESIPIQIPMQMQQIQQPR